jgi:hypothetical protein
MPLHGRRIAQRNLRTQHSFARNQFLHREVLFPLLDHLPFAFPLSSFFNGDARSWAQTEIVKMPLWHTLFGTAGGFNRALSVCLLAAPKLFSVAFFRNKRARPLICCGTVLPYPAIPLRPNRAGDQEADEDWSQVHD